MLTRKFTLRLFRCLPLIMAAAILLLLSACGADSTQAPPTAQTPPPGTVESTPVVLHPFILPFDTTDSSVVLRSSLTSASEIQVMGGIEEPTSANEFDSQLGMLPRSVSGGVPGVRFSASSIAGLADLPSGQLSIDVEREWLAVTDPEVRSAGYIHSTHEHLLSYGIGETQTAGKLYIQPNQSLLWFFRANEFSRSTSYVNTTQSNRFARITISWTPGISELYVDGLRTASLPRVNPASGSFSTIYIANMIGSSIDPFRGDYYIRNLLVSSKPVIMDPIHPPLNHIMLIGDSFVGGVPFYNIPNKYDGTIANTIIKRLISQGASFGDFSAFSNGGGQIQDNGLDPLELDAGQGQSRADALTQDPSLIVFITGGNDTAIFDSAQFTTDLHDHIEAFLGENGYPQTTTYHVIVTTTASNLNANHPATLQMRQIMLELPDWWDDTYPLRAGAVSVIDTWALFGGSHVDSTLFGIADTVHPAASGNIVYGEAIAEEILRLVKHR